MLFYNSHKHRDYFECYVQDEPEYTGGDEIYVMTEEEYDAFMAMYRNVIEILADRIEATLYTTLQSWGF